MVQTLMLSAFVLFAMPDLNGLVICRGSGGHAELEIAVMGACASCVTSDHISEPDSHESLAPLEGDHCGTCIDTPLAAPLTFNGRAKQELPVPVFFLPACLTVLPTQVWEQARRGSPPRAYIPAQAAVTCLKTVILLI